ncbi:hypothetical protein M3Y96_01012700 [Aphelenchoides besseyi]|nr:hypothetical protein M3Y96_01012700 [Aphelenchoides besseyi]
MQFVDYQFVYTLGQELHSANTTEYALLAIELHDLKLRNVVQKFMSTSYDNLISIFLIALCVLIYERRDFLGFCEVEFDPFERLFHGLFVAHRRLFQTIRKENSQDKFLVGHPDVAH